MQHKSSFPIDCAHCLSQDNCKTPCVGYDKDIRWLRKDPTAVRLVLKPSGALSRVSLFPHDADIVSYPEFNRLIKEPVTRCYATLATRRDADLVHFLYGVENFGRSSS